MRRRTALSEGEEHRLTEQRLSDDEGEEHHLTEQRLSEHEGGEHRLTEQRLLEHEALEQRRSEQFLLEYEELEQRRLEQRIRELRPPRRAGRPERRRRVRVLYTNRWTESQRDLAELATEGQHETHRPGEAIIYRFQLLERPDEVANIRRGLTTTIVENGWIFKFDLLQMHDGEVTWVVQVYPEE